MAALRPTDYERAFSRYNRHRLQKLKGQLAPRDVETLELLPFLLHVNQPGLPGYVNDPEFPAGVVNYSPSTEIFELSRRVFSAADPRPRGAMRLVIELVGVMGSAGTIGFTHESDLDVWVCYRAEALREGGVEKLREKVGLIERWMNGYSGREVHLFLQSVDQVRENHFGETDLEGCGSALGALLKEEFYRTAIILGGNMPFWCLVPVGCDAGHYAATVAELKKSDEIDPDNYIDLGWAGSVPLGELFGAAVWQIAKGQKAPFKSALKMGLLERTVCSKEAPEPLCETCKREVLEGVDPDPYRTLFDNVLAYYERNLDTRTKELLAQCFYLKAGRKLDPVQVEKGEAVNPADRDLMDYVVGWGWGKRKVSKLNGFSEWRFERVQTLGRELDKYFLRSYKRIRTALQQREETHNITGRDLTILGRQLQTAYRKTAHKVELFNMAFKLAEEQIVTALESRDGGAGSVWSLYAGAVNPLDEEELHEQRIKSFETVLELLVWGAHNRVLGENTRIVCRPLGAEFTSADLEGLAPTLLRFARAGEIEPPPLGVLLDRPRPTRMLLVPNFGIKDDQIVELSALYRTSWGETYLRGWSGSAALRSFFEELLLPYLRESEEQFELASYTPRQKVLSKSNPSTKLFRQLPLLGKMFAGRGESGSVSRYVGKSAEGFYVIERDSSDTGLQVFDDAELVVSYLAGVGKRERVETMVEEGYGILSTLGGVFNASEHGMIDIFVAKEHNFERFYVVDEIGNFIDFEIPRETDLYNLSKLLHFIENVLPEVATQSESPLRSIKLEECVRIHTLIQEDSCRVVSSTHDFLGRVAELGLKPTGLSISRSARNGTYPAGYTVNWDGEIIEGDSPLAELRKRIVKKRTAGRDYGLFVTDLFLDNIFRREAVGRFASVGHYLFYKKAIEQKLAH